MSDVPARAYADSLSFRLAQIGAVTAHRFEQLLSETGVTPRQFGVLSNLSESGSQTQQELADALGIHRNNMVGLIDELEAAGWVGRHRSASDRRAFDVRLTVLGSRLARRAARLSGPLDEQLAADLSATQRAQLSRLLATIATTLGLTPGVHPRLGSRRTTLTSST